MSSNKHKQMTHGAFQKTSWATLLALKIDLYFQVSVLGASHSQPCTEYHATFICGLATLYSSRAPDVATPPMMPYCTCQKLTRNVTVKGSRSSSVEGAVRQHEHHSGIKREERDTHGLTKVSVQTPTAYPPNLHHNTEIHHGSDRADDDSS